MRICWQFLTESWLFLGGILLSFWHIVMVLNSFLMILSGLLRGLDDFLTVSWECLMNNCGRSLLRAEWSRTSKKLTSWLFGTLLVQIRIVGRGPIIVRAFERGKGTVLSVYHNGTIQWICCRYRYIPLEKITSIVRYHLSRSASNLSTTTRQNKTAWRTEDCGFITKCFAPIRTTKYTIIRHALHYRYVLLSLQYQLKKYYKLLNQYIRYHVWELTGNVCVLV